MTTTINRLTLHRFWCQSTTRLLIIHLSIWWVLGAARKAGSSRTLWWKGNYSHRKLQNSIFPQYSRLLRITKKKKFWLIQLNQPRFVCRVTPVQMDLLGLLDYLEKRWMSLIQPPLVSLVHFIQADNVCPWIGRTWRPWRRWKTWRQRSNGELPFPPLLCAFPFYVDAHGESAESFAEVAGTYVKSRSAYCDCCITYLVRFQGETGKQGPVGPAGPPGIIVRHSIFNVLYRF